MTAQFTPRPYQRLIIDHILSVPRCAIWADMGTGKTVSTLTALDMLTLVDDRPALVIAPLRVAATTWPQEAQKWAHLSGLRVVAVVGTPAQRKAALASRAQVYCINYDNLPWLLEQYNDGAAWPFATVVADEATRLKSFRTRQGSVRARALARVAHKRVDRFIALTGTPAPNGLQDLWGQSWFIDAGRRLGSSFVAFTNRWFRSVRVGSDRFAVRLEPFEFAQGQIEGQLKDVTLRIDAADWFDIGQPIMQTVRVQMPESCRTIYRELQDEMLVQMQNATVQAFNAASLSIKCLQLANGALYTSDAGDYEVLHDAKIDALRSIVEEAAGSPVLVAYHFKSDLERLQKAFPAGRHLDKNPQTIADWNSGKIPLLFAHPASAGHGLNLQDGGHHLAFFGHWWNLEEYQQIIERIGPVRQAQAGHRRPVYIYHIVTENTVDETVMLRRETKREVQELLLEAMK